MRLRQLALVARDLDPIVEELCSALSLTVAFRDPGVGEFGLRNALMAIGDTFLEVVSPQTNEASAARFLERRRGDGGYMVILQTDDLADDRARLDRLGVRIVWEVALEDIATAHIHPRDIGGAIVSLDQPVPPESWRWAGPSWREHVCRDRIDGIVAAEIQAADATSTAERWAAVLGLEARANRAGEPEIALENAVLRFAPDRDGRGDGLAAFDVRATDGRRDEMAICGTRIRLV